MILLGLAIIFILITIRMGYRMGLVNAVLRFILWVIVWYIAIKFSKPFGQLLTDFVSGQFVRTTMPQSVVGDGSQFLASGLVFTIIFILGGIVSHWILKSFSVVRHIPLLGWFDAILGGLLYGIMGAVIAFFALELLSVMPNVWIQDQFLKTPLLNDILDNMPFFANQIYNWWL
ncbi:CvpA family protein [Leuconostoc mesenteroides]|uniref:CvpA family protein n=1 Tax=Leuconostoc mesenteroides TaxID=1245 RepID=UPI00235F0CBA|nr:CvpA family protein [Leuconostoc mesenteroides]